MSFVSSTPFFFSMIEKHINSLPMWFFQNLLECKEICHFVSTRIGGFSSPPYDSLNLGLHVGDHPETVLKNRKLIASALNIPLGNFTIAKQIHDCNVEIITDDLRGSGVFDCNTAVKAADAMVTDTPDICLMVFQADCVPVLFFDVKKKVIGVAHAGWKGTVLGVTQNTIKVFMEKYKCLPENILVGIGPSIGPCCYEVGSEVIDRFENVFLDKRGRVGNEISRGKGYLNLWEANKAQLLRMGIPEKNIEVAGICTFCNHTLFYSYRQGGNETGRFAAGIMLIPGCDQVNVNKDG